jgi:hypothetical protein
MKRITFFILILFLFYPGPQAFAVSPGGWASDTLNPPAGDMSIEGGLSITSSTDPCLNVGPGILKVDCATDAVGVLGDPGANGGGTAKGFDVWAFTVRMGSDNTGNGVRATGVNKALNIVVPHITLAEEDWMAFSLGGSATASMAWGGGHGDYNSVNTHKFYTNEAITGAALTGSQRFYIDKYGNVIVGSGAAIGTNSKGAFQLNNAPGIPTTSPADTIQMWSDDYGSGDARLYIMSENSTDKVIIDYGEMYLDNSSVEANTGDVGDDVGITDFTQGTLNNFTFDAGLTGTTSAQANQGGGQVQFTVNDTTGLTNGDYITIGSTTDANYNTYQTIDTVDDGTHFTITVTEGGDGGAGFWTEPSHLIAGNTGIYKATYNMSVACSTCAGGGEVFLWSIVKNITEFDVTKAERSVTSSAVGAFGGGGVVSLTAGDWVWVEVHAVSGVDEDVGHKYGSLVLTGL